MAMRFVVKHKEKIMTNKNIWMGIPAVLLAFGLVLTGCDTGGGSSGSGIPSVTYTGNASGKIYRLTITENSSKAAYTPKSGDSYELLIGSDRSEGTVSAFTGGTFTLAPTVKAEATFKVTVSDKGISAISGKITLVSGKDVEPPDSIVGGGDNGSSGGTGGGGDGNDLPAITEPTTGRLTVSYTDVPISGAASSLNFTGTENLGRGIASFSIVAGKLTLALVTPTVTTSVTEFLNKDGSLFFGNTTGDNKVTASGNPDVTVMRALTDKAPYLLRVYMDTDGATYYNRYEIIHVYVSADVTFTRVAKTITIDFIGGPVNFSAVNLPLKTGCNLVQTD
jgi:hypothetical protein